MPNLPQIGPPWLAPALPWLLVVFAVITIAFGFFRGPLHGTNVYGWRKWIVIIVGVLFALSTPALVFAAIADKTWCGYAIALSTVLPPIWFFLEYFYIVDHAELRKEKVIFDSFKHAQDTCAKVWLAVVALLVLIFKTIHKGF